MSITKQIPDDLAARGQKFYQEKLQALLEPAQIGNFVAIEPETERYFVATSDIEALLAARAALPESFFYLVRVGYQAAHKIGGALHGTGKRPSHRLR